MITRKDLFKNINLQLFAEETEEATAEQAKATEQAAETKAETKVETKAEEAKYTDAEVDRLINQKRAEWERKKEEADKVAKMDNDEKHKYELEQERKEKAELQKELDTIKISRTASTLLKESKIDATDDILSFVVGEDETQTKANINKFVKIIEEQVKKAEKERATGLTPKNYENKGDTLSEIEKRIAKYN